MSSIITQNEGGVNGGFSPEHFLNHLMRGGKHGHYFNLDTNTTTWWDTTDIPDAPTDTNLCFGINPVGEIPTTNSAGKTVRPDNVRSRANLVVATNTLFAEFDAKDLAKAELAPTTGEKASKADVLAHYKAHRERFDTAIWAKVCALPLKPSVIISSGHGYHVYWLLADVYSIDGNAAKAENISKLLKDWVKFVGGDSAASDLARILRLPGTYNIKSDYPGERRLVEVIESDLNLQYKLSDFESLVASAAPATAASAAAPVAKTNGAGGTMLGSVNVGYVPIRQHANGGNGANGASCPIDVEYVKSLLERLSPDRVEEYEPWRNVGFALRSLGNEAYPLFVDWSRKSRTNFSETECKKIWEHSKEAGITFGSLKFWADQDDPRRERVVGINNVLLNESCDDEGNARCVMALYGDKIAFVEEVGWMAWNGSHWDHRGGDKKVQEMVTETLRRRSIAALSSGTTRGEAIAKAAVLKSGNIQSCMYMLKPKVLKSYADFDRFDDLLNCANGVVNLRTGTIEPHSPDQLFTYCTPVAYNPEADQTLWRKFVTETVDSDEIADYLQRSVGYSITGHTNLECMWYVYGPPRSGKGTFSEALLAVLGAPIGRATDFGVFTGKREEDSQNFRLAGLKAARFVAAGESGKYEVLNEAKAKMITGGDTIEAAFKFKDSFEFQPKFKVWLFSNNQVRGDVDDDAFWSRVKVVPFAKSKLGSEDETLKLRLKEPAALEGVLAWAVEGAQRWFASGMRRIDTPQQIVDAATEARNEGDYVKHWLDECTTYEAGEWVSNEKLYASYKRWCDNNGVRLMNNRGLGAGLSKKGFVRHTRSNSRGFYGIKLIAVETDF